MGRSFSRSIDTPLIIDAVYLQDICRREDTLLSLIPPANRGVLFFMPPGTSREKMTKNIINKGFSVVTSPSADDRDYLTSLLFSCVRADIPVTLLSGDILTQQLIGPRIDLYLVKQDRMVTAEEVMKTYGVDPWKLPDLFALIGLKERDIPGTLGIDSALGCRLLSDFNGIEELLNRLDLLEIHAYPKPTYLQNILKKQETRLLESYQRLKYHHRYDIPVNKGLFTRRNTSRIL